MPKLSMDLDRSSPIPLYFQVARQIEQAIEHGHLGPGSRLGNEIQLADSYGLSRLTMRRAIQELVNKGLLVRKRGVGTQVVHGQVRRPVELTSLYDDLARANQKPMTQVLVHETAPAPDEVAIALGQAPGCEVVRLERLRLTGEEPLAILRNWLPVEIARFTAADLQNRGLYALLRASGVNIRVASQQIGARAGKSAETQLLGVRRSAPVLTMRRTAYDDSGKAVEFGNHVYRSDNYSFEITLVERR